jgi:hypothetical protein
VPCVCVVRRSCPVPLCVPCGENGFTAEGAEARRGGKLLHAARFRAFRLFRGDTSEISDVPLSVPLPSARIRLPAVAGEICGQEKAFIRRLGRLPQIQPRPAPTAPSPAHAADAATQRQPVHHLRRVNMGLIPFWFPFLSVSQFVSRYPFLPFTLPANGTNRSRTGTQLLPSRGVLPEQRIGYA